MAHYEHLPIYKAALDLCVYFELIVRNFDRLVAHEAFLGGGVKVKDAYKMIWDNHNAIAKRVIQCSWMAYDAELEQNVLKRGSITDWENAGSPVRVENYIIPHVWMGGK